jgi:hypothetical protein
MKKEYLFGITEDHLNPCRCIFPAPISLSMEHGDKRSNFMIEGNWPE